MCEFTGWVNLEEDLTREKRIIENMMQALGRSAAESSTYVCNNALFGCRSVDGEDCKEDDKGQPISKSLGNNKYTVSYIGQLENFKEIVAQLRKLGMDYKGNSDAELLITAYMAWGQEFIKHMRGKFTLAVWDESRKNLLLARDPVGEKHLFYAIKSSSIIFASEVKMLLAHPLLDPKAAHTLIDGIPSEIKELKPGNCLIFSRQGMNVKLL